MIQISMLWLIFIPFLWVMSLVYIQHFSYVRGIWDGAFNQFLPFVQEQMHLYDPHRAAIILGEANRRTVNPWIKTT